jgi:hypothetical protein
MGVSPGEESRINGVAAQTIEAQPVFGQIKPSQRPGASHAETRSWEKTWLISVMLYKRLNSWAKKKKHNAGNGGIVPQSDRREQRPCTSMRSGTEIHPTRSKRWGKTMAFFRSSPEHPSRRFARTCSTTRVKRSSLSRGGRENWLRTVADHPARFDWSGFVKTAKRIHAVPPMKTTPTQAKTSRQTSDGTPICAIARTT